MATKKQQLDAALQSLIHRYGNDNPRLKADLEALKRDLDRPCASPTELAHTALRLATWAKWIYDFFE